MSHQRSSGEYLTELGALKAQLEWAISIPGRAWIVEGYNVIRYRSEYRYRYQIDQRGPGGGKLKTCNSLTEAFRWIADRVEER